ARALEATVEELFAPEPDVPPQAEWAVRPATGQTRYWQARLGNRILTYPVEDDSPQLDWHDGIVRGDELYTTNADAAERTLVLACCDPAAGLLAAEYARQFQFRMIVLRRSSREALDLLAAGKVHVAGAHLGQVGHKSQNSRAARATLGDGCRLLRVA